LWDVVASAARNGSLDGNIRHHSPNALADLATSLPRLNAIAFNGGTAARIARKQLARETRLVLVSLPSSSPAYTLAYERKARGLAEAERLHLPPLAVL
jgi:hypoxanthine-DNA glycosylase